jgi:hypothetical protein
MAVKSCGAASWDLSYMLLPHNKARHTSAECWDHHARGTLHRRRAGLPSRRCTFHLGTMRLEVSVRQDSAVAAGLAVSVPQTGCLHSLRSWLYLSPPIQAGDWHGAAQACLTGDGLCNAEFRRTLWPSLVMDPALASPTGRNAAKRARSRTLSPSIGTCSPCRTSCEPSFGARVTHTVRAFTRAASHTAATDPQFEHAYQDQVMIDVRRSFHFKACASWSQEERYGRAVDVQPVLNSTALPLRATLRGASVPSRLGLFVFGCVLFQI